MLDTLQSVLIVRLRNLGDCVLMTPVLKTLRRWRPGLEIAVLVERRFAPVFTGNPYLSSLEILDDGWGLMARHRRRFQMVRRLRKQTYDLVWNLHGGSTSLILTMSPRSGAQLGFEHYRQSERYSHCVPSASEIWGRTRVHTVETQLAPLKWMGLNPDPSRVLPEVFVLSEATERVNRFLAGQQLLGKPFVVVQPTATLKTKQWPVERFAALIGRIVKDGDLDVVVTAGPGEERIAKKVLASVGAPVAAFCRPDLEELKALLHQASYFVGNDSGPMHLAAALGRPVVSIFGSSNFSAWHPWGVDFEAVRSDLPCIPCPGYRCYEFASPRCIQNITVPAVFHAFRRVVERNPLPHAKHA